MRYSKILARVAKCVRAAQSNRVFYIFLIGVFATLSITFLLEAVREIMYAHIKTNDDRDHE